MTWNEFKEAVDAELEKLGKGGEIEIDYIDVPCCPSCPRDLSV